MQTRELLNRLEDKWTYLLPAIAFIIAFLLRYHFLTTYRYPMMIHEQDAVGYMDVAKSFLQFHLPGVGGRPPGYPIVIAMFAFFGFELETAARLASIFMDAMIVFPLYYLSSVFMSRPASFAASAAWAFFSFSLYFSPSPLSQSTYLFWLLSGVALLHAGLERRGMRWMFGSGASFALSYLARPEGIVGFVAGLFLSLLLLIRQEGIGRRTLLLSVSFGFGFFLLAFPYLAALRSTFGSWTLSPLSEAHVKTADVVLQLNAKGELNRSGATGLSVWKEHYKTLPAFLQAVRSNMAAFAAVYARTFPLWMHVVTMLGLFAMVRKSRYFMLMLIPLAATAPNFVVTIPKTHSYLYPVFALSFVLFMAFFDAVSRYAQEIVRRLLPQVKAQIGTAVLACVPLLAAGYVAAGFYEQADAAFQEPGLVAEALRTEKIYKGAGEAIRARSRTEESIMTRWGLIGYFAARPVITLPKGGVREVIDYGRKNGASFIVIDTNSVLSRRQELKELLNPLEGKQVDPAYGIEVFDANFYGELGGYVTYRYRKS